MASRRPWIKCWDYLISVLPSRFINDFRNTGSMPFFSTRCRRNLFFGSCLVGLFNLSSSFFPLRSRALYSFLHRVSIPPWRKTFLRPVDVFSLHCALLTIGAIRCYFFSFDGAVSVLTRSVTAHRGLPLVSGILPPPFLSFFRLPFPGRCAFLALFFGFI